MQYKTAFNHEFFEFNKRKCKKIFSSNASSWPSATITYRPPNGFLLTIIGYIKNITAERMENAGDTVTLALDGNAKADVGVQPAPNCCGTLLPCLRGTEDS